jgi:hypothetical protein
MPMPAFKTPQSLILCLLVGFAVVWAQPAMRGPLPAEQREHIQFMAEHHEQLERRVTLLEDGYEAETTTPNAVLAAKLKAHFAYMEKRLGSGAMVRRWDPAFVELVAHHDQIKTQVVYLDNGLKVVVKGTTPEGILVAQNHARIVTGFTQEGEEAVHRTHDPALAAGKDTGSEAATQDAAPAGDTATP